MNKPEYWQRWASKPGNLERKAKAERENYHYRKSIGLPGNRESQGKQKV